MQTMYLQEKFSLNKNLIFQVVLTVAFLMFFFLIGLKSFSINVFANCSGFPGICSGAPGVWCCEAGDGYKDYSHATCTVGNPTDWGTYWAYRCIAGGQLCGNGCYRCKGGSQPTPTDPPEDNPPKSCGERGCNNADYPHCTSGNICNADKCQVICGSGYHRVGDCSCEADTPPLSCGESGCDSYGCNGNNSCNGNVCQVNCPPGHTRSGNCSCLPPCSNLTFSFSQNACILDIAAAGASSYLTNVTISGPTISKINNTLYRHTITSSGTKTWTLNWQESASVGSGATNCAATISKNIPAPVCGSITGSTNPSPLIWGDKVTMRAIFNPPQASAPHTYSNINVSHSTLTACLGDVFASDGETCTLPWVAGNPKSYPWSITWRTTDKVCNVLTNNSCNWSSSMSATNRPSYMKTVNGVSYIKTQNNQPYFNTVLPDNFSTSIFGSNRASTMDQTPNCTGTAIHCTKSNYLLLSYSDSNFVINPLTWYSFLKGSLERNTTANVVNWTGAGNLSALMASPLSDTKVNVIKINGDLTATGQCHGQNIFLISNNLTITPDLTIANTSSDACLFIVNGTTRIMASTKTAMTCGGNHIDPRTDVTPRDEIQAFIITTDFTTNASAVQLYVKGGVITNTFNNGLNRKVNTDSCLFPNLPSEVMDYEGSRYLKAFNYILGDPVTTSIREIQYTGRN